MIFGSFNNFSCLGSAAQLFLPLVLSRTGWDGLEKVGGDVRVESELLCGVTCSSLGEECSAVHHDGDTKTCSRAKVQVLGNTVNKSWPGLLYKEGTHDNLWQ